MARTIIHVSRYIDEGGPLSHEVNSGHRLTDSTGYIPPSKFIPQLIKAGVLLDAQRAKKSYYDYPNGGNPDDMQYDPTTAKDFDVIRAAEISSDLRARFDAVKAESDKAAELVKQQAEIIKQKDAEKAEAAPEK